MLYLSAVKSKTRSALAYPEDKTKTAVVSGSGGVKAVSVRASAVGVLYLLVLGGVLEELPRLRGLLSLLVLLPIPQEGRERWSSGVVGVVGVVLGVGRRLALVGLPVLSHHRRLSPLLESPRHPCRRRPAAAPPLVAGGAGGACRRPPRAGGPARGDGAHPRDYLILRGDVRRPAPAPGWPAG